MSLASTASAFELRQTTSGQVVHWPTHDVSIEIDPSMMDALPEAIDAVVASAASWSATHGGPELSVTVSTTASSPAVDGRNVVHFSPQGLPAGGDALAVTLVSFDDVTGEIVDADIVLNGRYAFAVLPSDATPALGTTPIANDGLGLGASPLEANALAANPPPANSTPAQFDLIHVLSHETGHLLGLLDATGEPKDLMYVYTSAHDASRRAPALDDVAGLDALYNNAGSQSACGMITAPRSTDRGNVAILMLGFGWVAVWRRRATCRPKPT
jgi:hypothetical protein